MIRIRFLTCFIFDMIRTIHSKKIRNTFFNSIPVNPQIGIRKFLPRHQDRKENADEYMAAMFSGICTGRKEIVESIFLKKLWFIA